LDSVRVNGVIPDEGTICHIRLEKEQHRQTTTQAKNNTAKQQHRQTTQPNNSKANNNTAKQQHRQTTTQPNNNRQTTTQPNNNTAKQQHSQTTTQPNNNTAKQQHSQTTTQPNNNTRNVRITLSQAPSCNCFCSGQALSVTYFECVFLAVVIQHERACAMLSSWACPAVQYFSTLSH
jgi:hypothetical protein